MSSLALNKVVLLFSILALLLVDMLFNVCIEQAALVVGESTSAQDVDDWNEAFNLAKQMCGGQVYQRSPALWKAMLALTNDATHTFEQRLRKMRFLAVRGLIAQGQPQNIPAGWPTSDPW